MAESSRDEALEPWRWLLLSSSAVLRAIEQDLAAKGAMSLAWYDVLLELDSARDRRLTMSELGDRVVLSRTRVSRIVDELESAGLVERVPNPADGRSAFAQITAAGRRELRRTAPTYVKGIEAHFLSHLDESERDVIATALRRVAEHHREPRTRPTG